MKGCSKGITILETVISIIIVAFVLIGMLQLYSYGAILSSIAKHKASAMNLAQSRIEEEIDKLYSDITAGTTTRQVKIDTGKTGSTGDDINGTMTTAISSVSEGYKIIVTVTWNDYYGALNEIMESTITSYE